MPEPLLIIPGIARSKYAKTARRYERLVRRIAQGHFSTPLTERNLSVEVQHFYTTGNAIDLDNLLKALLDGLKGGAYLDDGQIVRVAAQRYNISESFSLGHLRPAVVDQLAGHTGDFVSIEITRLD